jgi:predicted RNase H-like nuclease (RuvC/YqgF family)
VLSVTIANLIYLENECKETVDKYKQELNLSRERVLELMSEIQRYEREVFMLRADKKRMNLEIGDFEHRQQSFDGSYNFLIL